MTKMPEADALIEGNDTTMQDREFFKFSGAYYIAPGTTPEAMTSDAACFLDSAESITKKLIDSFGPGDSIDDQSLAFGVLHLVTMAKNLCQRAQVELERARWSANA